MKREIITIDENGNVTIPDASAAPVLMQDFEVAELFGVMLSTVKSNIRAILKSGVITADVTNGATLVGCNILPDYFGLEVITALAFRIHSHNAQLFRKSVFQRMRWIQNQSIAMLYIPINRDLNLKQSEYSS